MNEPSAAKRPDFQLESVPNARQLNPFNTAFRPSRFDPEQLERPGLSFDPAIGPRQLDVMSDPLTPSIAEVKSAINEVKALNQKEAQVNKELFDQSKYISTSLKKTPVCVFYHTIYHILCIYLETLIQFILHLDVFREYGHDFNFVLSVYLF